MTTERTVTRRQRDGTRVTAYAARMRDGIEERVYPSGKRTFFVKVRFEGKQKSIAVQGPQKRGELPGPSRPRSSRSWPAGNSWPPRGWPPPSSNLPRSGARPAASSPRLKSFTTATSASTSCRRWEVPRWLR